MPESINIGGTSNNNNNTINYNNPNILRTSNSSISSFNYINNSASSSPAGSNSGSLISEVDISTNDKNFQKVQLTPK